MVESESQEISSSGQGYKSNSGNTAEEENAELNPFIQNKNRQRPEVWCTVQGLGAVKKIDTFNQAQLGINTMHPQGISVLKFDKQG